MYQDETWIRRQVINLWFEHSQEEIGQQLGISLGKVNSIIQEFCIREEPVAKVRDMVMSASKNGVNMNQLISNLRYQNAVKKFGSDNDKLNLLLKGLAQILEKNEADPEKAAELMYQILEIAYKEQKSPVEIRDDLNSKIEQERMLQDKIQNHELMLKSNSVTPEEVRQIKYFKYSLRDFNISEFDQFNNLINNIRETHYDPLKLIEYASSVFSISQECETIQKRKIEELGYLADTEIKSTLRREAIRTYEKISKRGYSEQGIADLLAVVDDIVQEYKYSPNSGNDFIGQIRNDLSISGSLSVANISLKYQNNELNQAILSNNRNATRSNV